MPIWGRMASIWDRKIPSLVRRRSELGDVRIALALPLLTAASSAAKHFPSWSCFFGFPLKRNAAITFAKGRWCLS